MSKEKGHFLGLQLQVETRKWIPSTSDKGIDWRTTLLSYFSFKSTAWCISVALLQNVLPHQFIYEKVKIVEAVYFANTLNQSCLEFFRHQKAALLNEPHPLPVLTQLWGSEQNTTYSFTCSFIQQILIEGRLAARYSTQLWRHQRDQNTVPGLKIQKEQ